MKLDTDVFGVRLTDTASQLAAQDLKALIVYATGSTLGPSSRTHGYIRYLCDWDSHHAPSVLVLRADAAPVLLVPNIFMVNLGKQYHWIDDIRFVKIADFARETANLLSQSGFESSQIGLVGRNEMPVPVWEGLVQALPKVSWKDFTSALDQRRVVKDTLQIAMHQRAAEICDEMFVTLAREIRNAKPAYQLQADMERTARYLGCEYCMTWLTVMPQADYSRFFKEECLRIPQTGDQVFAGIYLIYEGHWGHAIRGGTFGKRTDTHLRLFDIALEMQDTMLAGMKPGANLGSLQQLAESIVHRHYPDADKRGVFRFRHGHGLGMSYEDPISSLPFPQIYDAVAAPAADLPGQVGMLFELHPNIFVPGEGGAVIGDMVTITSRGPRILNQFPRELAEF